MRRFGINNFVRLSFVFAVSLSVNFAQDLYAEAAAPGQQAVETFLGAVKAMEFPVTDSENHRILVEEANKLLDIEAMSRNSLSGYWEEASPEDRRVFVDLLTQLIEAVGYPKSSRFLGDLRIDYPSVEADGSGVLVTTIVVREENEGLSAEIVYHVSTKNGTWAIDDVFIDGISITEDFNYQFSRIIDDSSFSGLLEKMRERLATAKSESTVSDS